MKRYFRENFKKDLFIFISLFIFCSILILIYYPEHDWDFYNYQLYNGWAFLTNRIDKDFMATNFRSYWNPYLEAFQYLMAVKLNHHRFIYAILMGLDTVLALFLTYKISDKVILKNLKNRNLSVFLTLAYVTFSPIMYRVLDASKNDMIISTIILLAFYFLLDCFEKNFKKKNLFIAISGCLIGLAFALKITTITYVLSFFFCLICLNKSFDKPIKTICIFSLSVICSYLIINSYWFYLVYSNYQNPFLPYFNNIFHSPYADSDIFLINDRNHSKANNLIQLLSYPFLHSYKFCYGFDKLSFDPRYAINFICLFILGICSFRNFNLAANSKKQVYFLVLFSLFSYEINTYLFGIYRYITAVSMLFGLILFLTISLLPLNYEKFKKFSTNTFFLFMILLVMVYQRDLISNKGILFGEQKTVLIPTVDYKIEDNAYVLLPDFGTSGFMVNQNKNAIYTNFVYPKRYEKRLQYIFPFGITSRFYSMFYFSSYTENFLKNILRSDKKIYIYMQLDYLVYYKNILQRSISYYSKNKRVITNCSRIDKNTESLFNHINIMCELEKKTKSN